MQTRANRPHAKSDLIFVYRCKRVLQQGLLISLQTFKGNPGRLRIACFSQLQMTFLKREKRQAKMLVITYHAGPPSPILELSFNVSYAFLKRARKPFCRDFAPRRNHLVTTKSHLSTANGQQTYQLCTGSRHIFLPESNTLPGHRTRGDQMTHTSC